MSLSPRWLDELRTRVTLSGVIGRTTRITKAGREFKACCPFHNEKTPSFTINDEKGFYHCFGCGAHGDVIRWMTDQRGLSFMDAVKELAAEAGMELPAPDPREAQRAQQRAGLHDVTAAAQDWFRASLLAPEGKAARDYLARRGFDSGTVEQFGFGFAPDSKSALKSALARFGEPMLVEAGLLIAVEGRDTYDRFRNRLMLPIHDARGRVIAFGGRILDSAASDAPKYLNSPDTPLFDKGRTLYNLHRAGPVSRKSGRMIVVEGYMDVIALAAAGIGDAVAPLGTALTETQIEMLWRLVPSPVLCFDGDAAGQRAAMRAVARALPLLRPGHSLRIVHLPAGLDPDDLIRRDGADAMEEALSSPATLLDTLWEHERDAAPLPTPEDKAGLKARLLAHVATIGDADIRALYRRELMDRFSAFAFPRREAQPPSSGARQPRWNERGGRPAPVPMTPEAAARLRHHAEAGGNDLLARAVLASLSRNMDQIPRHAEALARLAAFAPRLSGTIDRLLAAAEALEAGEQVPISALADIAAAPEGVRFFFLTEGSDAHAGREDLAEAVSLLVERPMLEAAIVRATAMFAQDPEGSWAEQQRLRKRRLEIERRLGQMASDRATDPVRDNESPSAANAQASGSELD